MVHGDRAHPAAGSEVQYGLHLHPKIAQLGRHVAESSPERYQPSNVTWALIEDVVGRVKKIEKRERQVARAIATIEQLAA